MSDYWYAPAQRELVRKYYFEDVERLPQYATENVLRARMAELPSVTNLFGWTAETIEQDASGVRVTIAESDGTRRDVLEADYLVGCDGSHSLVRSQVDIARSGTDFDQVMVLAVFRSRELHEALARFPERGTFNVLHPDLKGYWQFFGRVDVGEEFFFHAPVPANTTKDNYDFLGLLQKAAGFEFAAEFDYVGFWDLRVSVAETYQQRPRDDRRRRRAQPSAVRRLRPEQRPRRRRQPRLEARRGAARLGRRRTAPFLQRRTPSDLQGNRGRLHRCAHPKGCRVAGALQPRARQSRVRAGVERPPEVVRRNRDELRAEL